MLRGFTRTFDRWARLTSVCGCAAGVVALTAAPAWAGPDPYASLPSQMTIVGIVRDFKPNGSSGGHVDFQKEPAGGFGHYVGMAADLLDAEGKPQFASTGYKVTTQWKDASGSAICPPKPYIAAMPGDLPGVASGTPGGACVNAARFAEWFRDTPGVSMSTTLPITLNRTPGTCEYVFDDKIDPTYKSRGGFFPINGQLFGNYSNTKKNFHFSYELETTFRYKKGAGQQFTFVGDDDVWVFVEGQLVIDLGGIHSAMTQTVDMDRLTWLIDGQCYTLKFFFTERHTTQSNFRIETTLNLLTVAPPEVTSVFD